MLLFELRIVLPAITTQCAPIRERPVRNSNGSFKLRVGACTSYLDFHGNPCHLKLVLLQ